MKASKFNFIFPFQENQTLIYNTRTNALAVLDLQHSNLYNEFLNSNIINDKEFEKNLKLGGYILENDINEMDLLRMELLDSRYNASSLSITLAATADCNFRCIYCYEKESLKNSKMTLELQDTLLKFIEERIKTINKLSLSWYGGEPLLSFDIIEYLSPKIIEMCENNNVEYSSTIITNGYLLNDDICDKLVKYHITNIQITLDGPEEIHNKRRPLISGQGTFKKIIENISIASKYFENISIRINTDSENLNNVNQVISCLKDAGVDNSKVSVYLGYVEDYNNTYDFKKCLSLERFSKVNYEFIKNNNLNVMDLYPSLIGNYCCADFKNSYVIDSEGYLYKCWNDIGIKEMNIGHLNEEEHIEEINIKRYIDYMLYDATQDVECNSCKCLPICMGGCPNRRLSDSKRCVDKKFILDEYIKECAVYLLKQQQENN